jgi:hypothetical protein
MTLTQLIHRCRKPLGSLFGMLFVVVAVTILAAAAVCFRVRELSAFSLAAIAVWTAWTVLRPSCVGTTLGLVGVDLLISWAFCLYQADCVVTLGFAAFVVLIPGLICMFGSALALLMLPRGGPYGRKIVATVVALVLVPAIFFVGVFPFAVRQRQLRHIEQMANKIPILMGVIADVEAFTSLHKRLPTDHQEFFEVISRRRLDPNDVLGCCWRIDYSKCGESRYRLVYEALDVRYAYGSDSSDRGWYPDDRQSIVNTDAVNCQQPQNRPSANHLR